MRDIRLRGIPFYVHDNEDLSNAIVRNGDFWEADILDYIAEAYPEHDIIIDVGANIGNHTMYFATYLRYTAILSFEPWSENSALLRKNVAKFQNSWNSEIHVMAFPFGVSNVNGVANFNPNRGNMGAGEIGAGPESVIVSTLDSFIRTGALPRTVTLIKIDAEWHEPQVIEGAQKLIARDHPLILIEDANDEYGKLLPEYEKIKSWPHHKTYLYGWNE